MKFFKKEKKLYPSIEPFDSGFIKKGIHEIYYEQCGNPKGKPAVFLHGGPGGGAGKLSRRFFNPKKYRIILFDQRGCGKSKPHTCLEDNTTWHLVEDIESIRKKLEIEKDYKDYGEDIWRIGYGSKKLGKSYVSAFDKASVKPSKRLLAR